MDEVVPTDAELARSLPGGFESRYLDVDGVRLHYVEGGQGEPLVLLPAWPQTWWEFRHVLPELARHFRVFAVDVRGMGGSGRPEGGYDKKTMARDIHGFVTALGYQDVNIAGHDVGAMVAFSFAANHGAATRKLALLDVLHPDESRYHWPMLHRPGTGFPMYWWSFNQIEGLPEQIMAGRARYLVDWLLGNSLKHPERVSPVDRAVYARAYDTAEAIRATNGWYRALHQDVEDMATYGVLSVPVLGLVCPVNQQRFAATLPTLAKDARAVVVDDASHWLPEDQPAVVARELVEFFRPNLTEEPA